MTKGGLGLDSEAAGGHGLDSESGGSQVLDSESGGGLGLDSEAAGGHGLDSESGGGQMLTTQQQQQRSRLSQGVVKCSISSQEVVMHAEQATHASRHSEHAFQLEHTCRQAQLHKRGERWGWTRMTKRRAVLLIRCESARVHRGL